MVRAVLTRSPRLSSFLIQSGVGLPVLIAAALFLFQLGQLDLWTPDEPRYAQVAEEMRSFEHGTKGLALLHLNGQPYTQKPPLYFWMAAAFGLPFGHVGHWAARLPSALAGIAVIGLIAFWGRRLYAKPETGLIAAMLLLGVFRFTHQARRAQLDVVLTLCVLLALMAFWSLHQRRDSKTTASKATLLGLHSAVGLGLMIKGPVAALPYLVMVVFLTWERRTADLRKLFPWWGALVALVPLALWFSVSILLAPAGHLGEAAGENLWTRFFSGVHHPRPIYYFLYQLPLDFLPWTPVVVAGIVFGLRAPPVGESQQQRQAQSQTNRFLLVWVGTFFAFFSISAEKRGLYLLPIFPALALIGAGWLAHQLEQRRLPLWLSGSALLVFGAVGVAGLLGITEIGLDALPMGRIPRLSSLFVGVGAVGFLAAGGLLWWHWLQPRSDRELAVLLIAPIALECLMLFSLFPAINHEKSYRPIAEVVAQMTPSEGVVGIYRRKPITGAIEYYSGRRAVRLETPTDLAVFYARGGRILIAPMREEGHLQDETQLRIIDRLYEDNRTLLVIELISIPKG